MTKQLSSEIRDPKPVDRSISKGKVRRHSGH